MRLQLIIIYWSFAVLVQSEDYFLLTKEFIKTIIKRKYWTFDAKLPLPQPSVMAMRMTSRYQRHI